MSKANCFDSLRLVAAMAVLVGHSYELPVAAQPHGMHGDPLQRFAGIDTLAALGVIMFFAISGYLVTLSLLRTRFVWQFALKRCLRIFPALWVFVLVATFLWGPLLSILDYEAFMRHPQTGAYLKNAYLSMQGGLPGVFGENPRPHGFNGSLWTLPIEFRLYVLLALFGLLGKRNLRPILFLFGATLCALAWWHFFRAPVARTAYFHVPSLFVLKLAGAFFVGSAVAAWKLENYLSWKWGAVAMVFLCVLSARQPVLQYYLWFPFALAVAYTTIATGLGTREFLAPLTRRGDFSYGIYLWAFPVQQTLIHCMQPVNVSTLIALSSAGTVVLAVASWFLVEKPALRLKPGAVHRLPEACHEAV